MMKKFQVEIQQKSLLLKINDTLIKANCEKETIYGK